MNHLESSSSGHQFNYLHHEKVNFSYPYNLNFQEYLSGAQFVDFIYLEGKLIGYVFSGGDKMNDEFDKFALLFSDDYDESVNAIYLSEIIEVANSDSLIMLSSDGELGALDLTRLSSKQVEYIFVYDKKENTN